MGNRIVTTDVEIQAAVIEACTETLAETSGATPNEDYINHIAIQVTNKLLRPPEKTSDITGFKEDDQLQDRW